MELQENAGNLTFTLPDEVFWIEESMARHWGREKVYVQAFQITSLNSYIPVSLFLHILLHILLAIHHLTISIHTIRLIILIVGILLTLKGTK